MQEKKKLRIADTNAVAVLEVATAYRNVVDKRSIQTIQVRDYELLSFALNCGVAAGDRRIGNAECCRILAANNYGRVRYVEDSALKFTGNGSESRVHVSWP